MTNDLLARSEEFPRLYRTAYEFAEEVSGFRDDVPLPAHQTLALAGDVFLRYLEGHDRELSLAEAQCRLAIHQAAREGVNAAVAFVEEKREEYENVTIGESVPEFTDKLADLGRARDLVNNSDLEFIWNHLHEYLPAFRRSRDLVDDMKAASGDLNVRRKQQDRDEKYRKLRIVLLVAALVVTIVGISIQQGCWDEEEVSETATLSSRPSVADE